MTKAVLFVRLGQIVDTDVRRSIAEFDKLFKAFDITIDWEDPSLFAEANKLFEKFNIGGYYASASVLRMAETIRLRNQRHRAPDWDALAENTFAAEFFALLKTKLPSDIAPEKLQALKEAWNTGWLHAWNAQCKVEINCLQLAARIVSINKDPNSRVSVMLIGGTNSAHRRKIVLELQAAGIDLTKVSTLFSYSARDTVPGMLTKFLGVNAGKYLFFQIPGNPELVQNPFFADLALKNEQQIQTATEAYGVINMPIESKLTPTMLTQIVATIATDQRLKAVGSSPGFTDMTPYPSPSPFGF